MEDRLLVYGRQAPIRKTGSYTATRLLSPTWAIIKNIGGEAAVSRVARIEEDVSLRRNLLSDA